MTFPDRPFDRHWVWDISTDSAASDASVPAPISVPQDYLASVS